MLSLRPGAASSFTIVCSSLACGSVKQYVGNLPGIGLMTTQKANSLLRRWAFPFDCLESGFRYVMFMDV